MQRFILLFFRRQNLVLVCVVFFLLKTPVVIKDFRIRTFYDLLFFSFFLPAPTTINKYWKSFKIHIWTAWKIDMHENFHKLQNQISFFTKFLTFIRNLMLENGREFSLLLAFSSKLQTIQLSITTTTISEITELSNVILLWVCVKLPHDLNFKVIGNLISYMYH